MGHEYFATLGETDAATWPPAVLAVAESLDMTVLARDERQVVLRWSPPAVGAPYEPDMWVTAHEDGCLMTFHSFARGQREQFLEALARNLSAALCRDVRFEET